jgi:large subunit ribosomal protein L30
MPRAKKKAGTLRLRLFRSMIGLAPRERATIRGLGFRRMNQVVERVDSPQLRGMLAKARHWVEVIDGIGGAQG